MPPSALEDIAHRTVTYPLMFTVTNEGANRVSHCGVLEFVAEEGRVYMPHWMMQNLFLQMGDRVTIETVDLQVATFAKVQPLTDDFLDISDPRAVLENALRDFSCLTRGDTIAINYNNKDYQISVLEVQPDDEHKAVSIVETDMRLDFEAPPGYEERQRQKQEAAQATRAAAAEQPAPAPEDQAAPDDASADVKLFYGTGQRLDQRNIKGTDSSVVEGHALPPAHVLHSLADGRRREDVLFKEKQRQRILPFTFGKLTFRPARAPPASASMEEDADDDDDEEPQAEPFGGQGYSLKPQGQTRKPKKPKGSKPKTGRSSRR